MAIRRSDRERHRRAFLQALTTGSSVSEAAEQAGIARCTLYAWRQDSAAFAASWDRAAQHARSALIDRMRSALIQRAVEGVDEPVFHAGKLVGTRKRYSDALLLAGLRQMTTLSPGEPKLPAEPVQPRIIIRPFEPYEEEMPPPIPAPETKPTDEPAAQEIAALPREPVEERALDWSHLGRHD